MTLILNQLLFLLGFMFLVSGIVIQDKPRTKYHASLQSHQTAKISAHYRQTPQKCDLICPGRPPLALPPNFMQNCSSVPNSTQNTGKSTTPKPRTTTESNEESDETDESTEETAETSTKKANKTTKKQTRMRHRKNKSINHSMKMRKRSKTKQQQKFENKKYFRKEKVMLKGQVKRELFKQNKHFKDRTRLDGCYVVCSEENQSNRPVNSGNPEGYGSEGTDIQESSAEDSGDNYVPGEDTPIEIIYISGQTGNNQRPVDLYQTNSFALLEPQPPFDYGYDSFFMEGKKKEIKNRKQRRKRKDKDKSANNGHL